MKSLTTYITLSVFFITLCFNLKWNIPAKANSAIGNNNLSVLTCPNPTQTADSLALIAIYNSTMGANWTNTWNTALPVCTPWDGVELDNEGYVIRLTLNNNNLVGTLPSEIGDLSRIEEFQLDNNNLSGSIPTEIGNLTNIEICFLDNNNFSGTIPEEFGNLTVMHTLYLDNNNLEGAVPITFLNLMNLFKFDIFNNNIDSVPNLSSTNLQPNKFRVYNNNLTFDDIVLNDLTALGTNYTPQDSVNQASTLNLQTGDNYTLDLGFDNDIPDNIYQWYKDGIIFGGPTNSNKLNFNPVTFATAGEYRCSVTNPNASLLTLHTRPVNINVSCGVSTLSVGDTLCHGGSVEINSVLFNASNSTGFFSFNNMDQYGCDSLIIIDLKFRPENRYELEETICIDDSIIVNNVVYNQANPTGTETFFGADQYGCDSIVEVNLTFYVAAAAGNLSPIICPGDSIQLFGTYYSQTQPTGSVILDNATATSCDSTIFIEVQFHPQAIGTYNPTICEGGSVNIGGQSFDETTPSGQVNLGPISQYGCDSFLNINLSFYGPSEGTYEDVLCFGDSVIINGVVYNQANPSGTELYPNGSSNNCDSIVFVNLSFDSSINEFLNNTLCRNDSIIVNNVIYNFGNPSGNEMISGGSSNGCDSTVIVNLSFYPESEETIDPTLCPEDEIMVNGTTYNTANPIGTEIIAGSSQNGCDSIVNVSLRFYLPAIGTYEQVLCSGDSVIINGVVYNETNPSGTEILSGVSSHGCDSTINIDLTFFNEITVLFNPVLCADSNFVINNTTYNFANPSGTEIIQNGIGCDSTINIDITFLPNDPNFITETLCAEQGIFINGTAYNELNPNGTEILEGQAANGCDSIVIIDLAFIQISEGLLDPTLCPGDSVVINGVVYNETNPTGIQFFENQAASGCDSSVVIDLSYFVDIPGNYSSTLCPGDSVIINGVTFNEANPNGTELLQNASFNGCDSTVIIDLNFYPIAQAFFDNILCEQDELIINNQPYNISNPSGTEIIPNGSANGCDSIIIIDLTFNNLVQVDIDPTLCPGDSVIVNNIIYNEVNPNGMELFPGGSANGCDSIVNINLSFNTISVETIDQSFCIGDSMIINGTVYSFLNPTGQELIENGAQNGCDSIVDINLSFHPPAIGDLNPMVCDGESFEYNGTTFDAQNPTGSITLEGASSNGCDSIIQIQLNFYDPIESSFNTTICDGDSLFFNGTIFHQNNSSGLVVLENASIDGCDSTINVHVNFYDPVESIFSTTICDGDSMDFHGVTYHQSNSGGMVVLENASSNGCDSTIQFNLNFHDPVSSNLPISICEGSSFEIGGQTFSDAGNYEILLENSSTLGCDSTVLLNLTVLDAEALGIADAGDDISQCENFLTLNANLPNTSTGLWSSIEDTFIENPQNASIDLDNLEPGYHHLIWTLSTSNCINYDSDTLEIYIQAAPDAVNDVFTLDIQTSTKELDFLQNDNLDANQGWMFSLLEMPTVGSFTELEEGIYQFDRTGPIGNDLSFEYQICDEDCPELCDTANVQLILTQQSIEDLDIPNAITPNGDGINEMFMFPHLEYEADKYPDKELIIFNRWGDIIYEAQPYLNDWNGVDQSGNPLPQGTYYFVLRLDIADGIILKGDVSILK